MMKLLNPIKYVLNHGVSPEKLKYFVTIGSITLVHVILVVMFSILHILPLILLNICSVLLYVSCLLVIKRNGDLLKVFYATYLEIIIQSFVATLCIGWRFGFPQYIIALVPFGYYMCHTLLDSKRRYIIATVMGLVAFISFVGCRILSMHFGSIYELDVSRAVEIGIYIFNAICNFAFLFMVTVIFIVEMQVATNKLQSQNAVLDKLASIDPLTGLYNRRSMQVFLDQALASEADNSFCLVMCDIDNFKRVNDTYGHDFGDIVLKQIAHIMERRISGQGYVCRWGGEEILLLVDNGLDQTCQIAEGIRCDVYNHGFRLHNQVIHCSVTIGVALHKPGNAIDDTITHADNNLYYGKRHGKNRVVSLDKDV